MSDQEAPVVHLEEPQVHVHKPMCCGGHSEWKPADERIQQVAEKVRHEVEAKHGQLHEYVVQEYTTQVVAGTNYKIKIRIAPDNIIEILVHQPLPHTGKEPHLL